MSETKEIYVEEKPSKWNFRNYFKSIKHYKWWVVGFTVLGTVLGYTSFQFILNPLKQKLSANFVYNSMPATYDGLSTYKFVDGTVFNISDLISKENLQAVKDSDQLYNTVNVDKIYKTGSLSIGSETVTSTNEQEEGKPTVLYTYFTISGRINNFPNAEIAKSFVYDLINYPRVISENAVENFEVASFLSSAEFDSSSFDQQLVQLSKQYKAIKDTYTQLQTDFGGSMLIDGQQLVEYINDFNLKTSVGQTSTVDNLSGELNSQNLVKFILNGTETSEQIIAKAKAKKDEVNWLCSYYAKVLDEKEDHKNRVKDSLEYLTKATTTNSTYNEYLEQVVLYTKELNEIQVEIDSLERQLTYYGWEKDGGVWKEASTAKGVLLHLKNIIAESDETTWLNKNKAFADKIQVLKNSLSEERLSSTKVYRAAYKNSKAVLLNKGYVTVDGGYSPFIGLAAGLVVGFLTSSLICCSIFIAKEDEKKE